MAINNPYVPGDPFSYDLKWLVRKIREHQIILDGLDERIQNAIIAALENLDQLGPKYFESAADLISSDLKDKSIAYIEGFFIPGDGGANLYYVTTDYNDIIGADFYLTLDGPNRWALPIIVTPYVTPEMFGAYGDGTEDDTDAMKVAVKMSDTVIGTKTYKITEEIKMKNNQKISGGKYVDEIPESSILREFPGVFTCSNVTDVIIENITIEGPGARTDATVVNRSSIKIYQSENVIVRNCTFTGIDSGYVIRSRESKHVTVDKCFVDGYSFTGIGFIIGNSDIRVTDNTLEGLTGTNGNTYPITLSGHEEVISVTDGAVCTGNVVRCPFPNWEGIDSHGGNNIIISDNIVEGTMTGIAVLQNILDNELADNIVIKGNTVTLGTDTSYSSNANNCCILCNASNSVITANVVNNGGVVCNGQGAERSIHVSGENVIVSDNVIRNAVGTIFWSAYADHMIVENNIVENWTAASAGVPYLILTNNGDYKDVFVRDNIATAPATAMLGRVPSDIDTAGGYIKYENNLMNGATTPLVANLSKIVCSPSTAAPVTNGRKGDIVINFAPATGQPIGWICTATFTNGSGGAWAALPNL